MKTKIALIGILAICGLAGCERKSAESLPTIEPENKKHADESSQLVQATPSPAAPQDQTFVDPATASTVWEANEATDWNGKWVRRGTSNVFDLYVTNKVNGEHRHHVCTVEVTGNIVTASHPDGTTYRGTLSADRTRIDGVHMWNGLVGNWTVRIDTTTVPRPLAPRLAPEGIYFLLRSVSLTTDSGVTGLHPGTELHLLRDDGATLHVSFGNSELDVSKTAVTNDLNVANAAFANDAVAQDNLARWGRTQTVISDQQEAAKMKEAQAQRLAVEQASAPRRGYVSRRSSGNPLDAEPYETSPLAGNRTSSAGNYAAAAEAQEIQRKNEVASHASAARGEEIQAQIVRLERQNRALQQELNQGRIPLERRQSIEDQIKNNEFNIDSLHKSK